MVFLMLAGLVHRQQVGRRGVKDLSLYGRTFVLALLPSFDPDVALVGCDDVCSLQERILINLVVKKAANVAVAQRVVQRSRLWVAADYGQVEGELMHELVCTNI